MISSNEYRERRENILKKMDNGSILILFAGQGRKKSGDENYPFQPNRNFFYLTGIKQENSALMLVKADGENSAYLFIDPKDEKVEKYSILLTSKCITVWSPLMLTTECCSTTFNNNFLGKFP